MLRDALTGYETPVPFNVKSNVATINFQTDGNNWGIPGYENGIQARWKLNFEVVYPSSTTVATEVTAQVSEQATIDPNALTFTCQTTCNYMF